MAMATFDTDKAYILANASARGSSRLAISTDYFLPVVESGSAEGSRNQQWFLTPTIQSSYYRLHAVSEGISFALDVLNNAGTHSTSLQMQVLGDYTGQFWRFDSWAGGPELRLSNRFTGPNMVLALRPGTGELYLAHVDEGEIGQRWFLDTVLPARPGIITPQTSPSTSPPAFLSSTTMPGSTHTRKMARPTTRLEFEIVILCALTLEADPIEALFDHHWDDDGQPYGKSQGDPNAYSMGAVGHHNVVLAYMPSAGNISAAIVASYCRASFPNLKLAIVVGICGAVPFSLDGTREIVLGDVIISDGVVKYDLGRQLSQRFERKDTLLDSLGRPNTEIRALMAKLKGLRGRRSLQSNMVESLDVLKNDSELAAKYPGVIHDKLFDASYSHTSDGMSCEACGCDVIKLVPRDRLGEDKVPLPAVHFGLIASGDKVMRSGEERDSIALREDVICFEMESAGVWDTIPCVVIKGACDYADSHKTKVWQSYAAATAAAGMKAFLRHWTPAS